MSSCWWIKITLAEAEHRDAVSRGQAEDQLARARRQTPARALYLPTGSLSNGRALPTSRGADSQENSLLPGLGDQPTEQTHPE
jgi:hypothetical protein